MVLGTVWQYRVIFKSFFLANVQTNVAQIFKNFFGYFEKPILSGNCCSHSMGQLLENIGLLFSTLVTLLGDNISSKSRSNTRLLWKNTLLVKTAVTTFWITAKLCYLFISLPCHTVHKPRQTMSHSTQFKASFRYCFIQWNQWKGSSSLQYY